MPDKEGEEEKMQYGFRPIATFTSPGSQASDAISSIDFSPDGSHFATGGLAKKIRLYRTPLLQPKQPADISSSGSRKRPCPAEPDLPAARGLEKVEEIYTPAKLSSLAWCPSDRAVISCGDYDGVVTEWDVECGVPVIERYDHGGRRVWSVDYSRVEHHQGLSASASADGTVRLWTARMDTSMAVIRPSGASVCSAQFSPFSPSLLVAASADGSFSLYDIRMSERSLLSTRGHARAVSYVRFVDEARVVSASIDNTVKVWDMEFRLERKWEGQHLNVKNFVGLSVLERGGGGLIACGSETNEVFVYHRDDERSLWRSSKLPSAGNDARAFVGAVCWGRMDGGGASDEVHSLVVANSDGSLYLIQARVLA